MKCPYRRNHIRKPEGDFEEFGECYNEACPYYHKYTYNDPKSEELIISENCTKKFFEERSNKE